MADTERTLAELQTLLATNTEKAVGAQDLRDFLVSALGGYGHIYVAGGSTAQTGLDTTPVDVDAWASDGEEDGQNVAPAAATNEIVIAVAGKYQVSYSASFDGTAATDFLFDLALDGTPTGRARARQSADGSSVHHVGGSTVLNVAAGQSLTLQVAAVAGSAKQITVREASLTVKRAG